MVRPGRVDNDAPVTGSTCRVDQTTTSQLYAAESKRWNKAAETPTKPFCIDQTFEPIIPIIGD